MYDLHMHSYYSTDGQYTPSELVQFCVDKGLQAMALSDHNTVEGVREACQKAQEAGIICIPAIEIDCKYEGRLFHMLGYNINYENPVYKAIFEHVHSQEVAASKKALKITREMGFKVEEAELEKLTEGTVNKGIWIGEMFAEVLLNKEEYLDDERLKPYREGGSRGDNPYVNFYWDFYSQGKKGYVDIHYPTMRDIIQIIHATGGIAVLAHPGQNLKEEREMVKEIIELGIDGIEVFSSYHSEEDIRYYYQAAKEHDLLMTRGTDFHGKTKPSIHIGEFKAVGDLQPSPLEDILKGRK